MVAVNAMRKRLYVANVTQCLVTCLVVKNRTPWWGKDRHIGNRLISKMLVTGSANLASPIIAHIRFNLWVD